MGKTIRARFSKGVIEPLEEVELTEGREITVTILDLPTPPGKVDALEASAGGWKDLIDAKELKENIYADRLISTRSEVRL
jgi:predicted DNA-binding antitoxin AbrB/MazE fold protein